MKFHKALREASQMADIKGVSVYIRLPHSVYEIEVSDERFRPVWAEDSAPMRKRSFDIQDFISDKWEVMGYE